MMCLFTAESKAACERMEAPSPTSEVFFVRIRPAFAVSALAVTGLLLAGCTGSDTAAGESPTPETADLCAAVAPTGSAVEAVTVSGDFGEPGTAEFETPIEIDELQRVVVTEGEGDPIASGDYVSYAITAFDADTGEEVGTVGYADTAVLPQQISPDSPLGQLVGCSAPGSRMVAAFPASESGPGQIWVFDVLGVTPTAAWGTPQEAVEGLPTVTLGEDGQPSVEIPDADAPDELQIAVLKEGDGEPVAAGDTTLLQYYGVDWETGESFDSSWANGAPYQNAGNQYVQGFSEALEGQPVGSQILVVIPPALAYGEEGESEHALAGQTLVFVVDILATQHAV